MPRGEDIELEGLGAVALPGPAKRTKRARALYRLLVEADRRLAEPLSVPPKQTQLVELALRRWHPQLFAPARHETRMELTVALLLDAEARAGHLCHYRDWRSATSWWTTPLAGVLAGWYGLPHDSEGLQPQELRQRLGVAAERPPFRLALKGSPGATLAEACAPGSPDAEMTQSRREVEVMAATAARVASVGAADSADQAERLRLSVLERGCVLPDEPREDDEDDALFDARRSWVGHAHADVVAEQIRRRLGIPDHAAWLRRYLDSVADARPASPTLRAALRADTRSTVQRLRAALGLVLDTDPRAL